MRNLKLMARTLEQISRCGYAAQCAALAVLLSMVGCGGGSLYKVKPVVEAPIGEASGSVRASGINVRAVPLLTDEENQELFEANLPLAGLLPIRVEINNEGSGTVALDRARFRLRDGDGRQWQVRSAKQAVSRILSANGVTFYNPQARKSFEEAVNAHALDIKTPLAPSQRRQGLIFFQTLRKSPSKARARSYSPSRSYHSRSKYA